jgi:hypothetical protein
MHLNKKVIAGVSGIVLALGAVALAQQSEFQAKIQEDMDGYKPQVIDRCGTTKSLTMRWIGKLAVNPRESEKPDWFAVSTLCTSGLDGLYQTCQTNAPVKAAISKVKTVSCTMGKGTLNFKLSGSEMTFTVDPSFTKNNPAGQESDFVERLKKELDK